MRISSVSALTEYGGDRCDSSAARKCNAMASGFFMGQCAVPNQRAASISRSEVPDQEERSVNESFTLEANRNPCFTAVAGFAHANNHLSTYTAEDHRRTCQRICGLLATMRRSLH